jgi:hypothetical protein
MECRRRLGNRADDETMEGPSGMVAVATLEHRLEHIRGGLRQTGGSQAEGRQDAGLKNACQAFAACRLDQAADAQVTHVRVGPTCARSES